MRSLLKWRNQLVHFLVRTNKAQDRTYLALTIVVGFLSAVVAVSLTYSVHYLSDLIGSNAQFTIKTFVIGAIFVLLSGWLTVKRFPETAGSGIPRVRIALAVHHGKIKISNTIAKLVVTLLSLSSGLSLGREGPTVSISAGLGSYLGTIFNLPKKRIKALVAIGSAGGIAAAFNTPISAVIFTLEEVVGDLNAKILGFIVIASVTASVTATVITGNEVTFAQLHYKLSDHKELIVYLILGVISALAGTAWQKTVLFFRKQRIVVFKGHRVTPMLIVFFMIGAFSFINSGFLGSGHIKIEETLQYLIADWRILLTLFSLKFLMTSLCYSTGLSGGLFMPTLLIGATLGSLVGTLAQIVFPELVLNVGPYALVGMGAFFVSVIRTPFTSILMIFEMTRDYQIILPLMIANIIAYIISSHFTDGSIYEEFSAQDGIHLPSRDDSDIMENLTVEETMVTEVVCYQSDQTIYETNLNIHKTSITGFPVLKQGKLFGMISKSEVLMAITNGISDQRLETICTTKPFKIYPDQSLLVAFHKLNKFNVSRLPVVSRLDEDKVIGIITAENIVSRFGYHIQEEQESEV